MISRRHVHLLVRAALSLTTLSAAAMAHASLIQYTGPEVLIDFDPDTFAFSRETTSFGGVITENILPSSVSYVQVGNGVQLDFNGLLSLYASSYTSFTPETFNGNFSAFFNFTPKAGYVITGYTVTYAGTYSIETPGSISINADAGVSSYLTTGSGPFSSSGGISGATPPWIQGTLNATGDLTTVSVYDGIEQVFDHYEQVLDYCDTVDPFTCYYHEEAVFVGVPHYHDETDLGEASVDLRTVTIQAHVAAVPEPGSVALLLAGLAMVGSWGRCKRHHTGC